MTKTELLNLANKGTTKISGISLEIFVFPSSFDGTPWIEIHVDPLSPLHMPLVLGQKWVQRMVLYSIGRAGNILKVEEGGRESKWLIHLREDLGFIREFRVIGVIGVFRVFGVIGVFRVFRKPRKSGKSGKSGRNYKSRWR